MVSFRIDAWGVKELAGGDVHAVPLGDLATHKKSRECWCRPRFQDGDERPAAADSPDRIVVVHQAADGRE